VNSVQIQTTVAAVRNRVDPTALQIVPVHTAPVARVVLTDRIPVLPDLRLKERPLMPEGLVYGHGDAARTVGQAIGQGVEGIPVIAFPAHPAQSIHYRLII
jgi:hypothetical protein